MRLFCIVHAYTVHHHSHTMVLFEASERKHTYFSPFMGPRRSRHMVVVICNVVIQHTGTCAHTKPISMTFERAGQSSASLPCQSLCVSTETDVSRGGRLSGLRRGVEHASSASHSQTTRGAAHSEEPRLHNLGQCRWSHPYGEEGSHGGECRRHRPTWILASSHSRILRLQLFWIQMQ